MTTSANKRVLVTRFQGPEGNATGREPVNGYVQAPESFGPDTLHLLTPTGLMLEIPLQEIKVVSFVKDFEGAESWRANRGFTSRPKSPGLWIRFSFRDGDAAEGVLSNNLAALDAIGFYVIPPDASIQNQRWFIPRQAVSEARVLGVVGARPMAAKRPGAKSPTGVKLPEEEQLELFS